MIGQFGICFALVSFRLFFTSLPVFFLSDPRAHVEFARANFKTWVFTSPGHRTTYCLGTEPKLVKHILKDNFNNYVKVDVKEMFEEFFGSGRFLLRLPLCLCFRRQASNLTFFMRQVSLQPMAKNGVFTAKWHRFCLP
jgi:hypothetical protein